MNREKIIEIQNAMVVLMTVCANSSGCEKCILYKKVCYGEYSELPIMGWKPVK